MIADGSECNGSDNSLNSGKRNRAGNRRGTHPNSISSLRPAAPGEVRNPRGNPDTLHQIRAAHKLMIMSAAALRKFQPKNGAEMVEYAQFQQAITGDPAAHREFRQLLIGDRLTVTQTEPFETEFVLQRETALADLAARSTHDRDDAGENGSHSNGS